MTVRPTRLDTDGKEVTDREPNGPREERIERRRLTTDRGAKGEE